jgi:3-methyladenine DNA glycosylase/8-oxoguanine DNA glycosylase
VATGRTDLRARDHERGWARLRTIPGIGSWTLEVLALHGQGRHDQLPAGDLAYLKLVGRLMADGDPYARATVEEVRAFFAPYAGWAGLAGAHALGHKATGGGAALRFAAAA